MEYSQYQMKERILMNKFRGFAPVGLKELKRKLVIWLNLISLVMNKSNNDFS